MAFTNEGYGAYYRLIGLAVASSHPYTDKVPTCIEALASIQQ